MGFFVDNGYRFIPLWARSRTVDIRCLDHRHRL